MQRHQREAGQDEEPRHGERYLVDRCGRDVGPAHELVQEHAQREVRQNDSDRRLQQKDPSLIQRLCPRTADVFLNDVGLDVHIVMRGQRTADEIEEKGDRQNPLFVREEIGIQAVSQQDDDAECGREKQAACEDDRLFQPNECVHERSPGSVGSVITSGAPRASCPFDAPESDPLPS